MTTRTYFIDRLRVLLTALVICFHVAIAYGSAGGWYWREVDDLSRPLSIALTVFTAVCQAFFMGMFFLLAGYYTPRSLARKGLIRFTQDRLLRLGVPLLVYGLLIGPFTIAMARAKNWDGFVETLSRLLTKGTFNWGPLWFAQALLIFTAGFVIWQCVTRAAPATAVRRAIPIHRWWLFAALAVAAGAWAIRLWFPLGRDVAGMTVGYFSSYLFLFFLGCAAWRHRWLEQVERQHAVPWGWVTLAAIPVLPAVGVMTGVFSGAASKLSAGGLIANAVYAFWEPFVAWGIIAMLLWQGRLRLNSPSPRWDRWAASAYGAYIVHPPIVVGLCLWVHGWDTPTLVKLLLVSALSVAASFFAASLLRRLPGANKVL
jgi:peptidoglycan/LPS O-acetylase OafA/YrhL